MSAKSSDFRRFPLLKPFSPQTPSKIFDACKEQDKLLAGWLVGLLGEGESARFDQSCLWG